MPDLAPSTIANLARCFNSCVPPGGQLAVANYLLAQIWKANDPMADVTPAALLNGARCFNSCIPDGMQLAVMNYTLYQILLGGGGVGGVIQYFEGNGAPAGMQPGQNPLYPAQYTDNQTSALYRYSAVTGTWGAIPDNP